jgi:hypothetical protein
MGRTAPMDCSLLLDTSKDDDDDSSDSENGSSEGGDALGLVFCDTGYSKKVEKRKKGATR